MTKTLRLCWIAAALLLTPTVQALGLGEIRSESKLGEPLVARIALTGVSGMTAEELLVSIADAEAYARMKIEREYTHTRLRFTTTIDKASGRGEILVETREPVRAPFLNFVLQVKWPQGNTMKAYTVLIEPPLSGR